MSEGPAISSSAGTNRVTLASFENEAAGAIGQHSGPCVNAGLRTAHFTDDGNGATVEIRVDPAERLGLIWTCWEMGAGIF